MSETYRESGREKKESLTYKDIGEWCEDHHAFVAWWTRHRGSGFLFDTDTGKTYWATEPWVAYTCVRFRVEFARDTGSRYRPPRGHIYTEEDFGRWATEQLEFENDGGNAPMSQEHFMRKIRGALAAMSARFAERSQKAKEKPKHVSPAEKQAQISALEQKAA